MSDPLSYKLKKKFDRYIHDPIIAIVILPFFVILKILPYKISSFICGCLLFLIAPFSKYQKRVLHNLNIAFPKKSKREKIQISKQFWFNFGQIIGELPHIDKLINSEKLVTIGHEKIQNGPAILIGAHLANWEFLLRVGEVSGRRVGFVYRPINNWILNKLQFARNSKIDADFFKKGRLAAIGMANKLKNGEVIGLTNDQILREGIMVPFFGKKAPTPHAAAIMSLKWDVPIFMVRLERIDMFNFKMTIEDEIKIKTNKKFDDKVYKLTEVISQRIEQWIIERPEQWLWAHRRWGK
ncbi:MAG: hypothetical protein CMN44_06540 [SAR116 cluster bacterium]|nr:hypothetical protein [SAR116 cluster bacterium]RPH09568.1 MAG: hypothetical protein CBC14_006420 [Alphaproteobacteria bacterium TMED54]